MLKISAGLSLVLLLQGAAYAQETSFANLTQGSGFQQLYDPIRLSDDGFGRYAIIYNDNGSFGKKVKMFMPPGTVMMTSRFINTQSGIPKAVWRFASPPQRTAASVVEGENPTQIGADLLQFLQTGTADIAFSGYQGGLSLSDGGAPITPAPQRGAYVYVDFFYNSVPSFDTTFFVEKTCYTEWYNSMTTSSKWINGNPDASATHTCSGSTGGGVVTPPITQPPVQTPTTTMSGFTLNQSKLTVGAAVSTVNIVPTPSTVQLPSGFNTTCTATPSGYLMPSNVTNGEWFVSSAASTLTAPVDVTVTCGSYAEQKITIVPSNYETAIQTAVVTDPSTNAVTLKVTLTRGLGEVAAGGTVDYWVAGLVPASSGTGFFFSQDQWFFLAQSGSSTGWTQMTLPSPSLVAFRRNSATSATEVLDIPLGFAQADVSPFKVQVHFGYRTSKTNVFVNKGVIWDSAK